MALRTQVINFIGLGLLDDPHQITGVREIPIVENQMRMIDMRIFVEVVNTLGIKE